MLLLSLQEIPEPGADRLSGSSRDVASLLKVCLMSFLILFFQCSSFLYIFVLLLFPFLYDLYPLPTSLSLFLSFSLSLSVFHSLFSQRSKPSDAIISTLLEFGVSRVSFTINFTRVCLFMLVVPLSLSLSLSFSLSLLLKDYQYR